jgi:hypothetical protein
MNIKSTRLQHNALYSSKGLDLMCTSILMAEYISDEENVAEHKPGDDCYFTFVVFM